MKHIQKLVIISFMIFIGMRIINQLYINLGKFEEVNSGAVTEGTTTEYSIAAAGADGVFVAGNK